MVRLVPLGWRERLVISNDRHVMGALRFTGMLELQRRMSDLVFVAQALLDSTLDRFQFLGSIASNHDVSLQCAVLLVELPDVKVMNPVDTIERLHTPDEIVQIEACRSAFHEHADGLREHSDDLPKYIARDEQGQRRVDPRPVEPDDGRGPDEDGH